MENKIVAIHQPNFFPWLGFFEKIKRSDVFIFLDDVQFPKTGGNWTNRVYILDNGAPKWLSAAVDRNYPGFKLINEIAFSTKIDWKGSLKGAIHNAYRKAPFYNEISTEVFQNLESAENNLSSFNIHMNKIFCCWLGIDINKTVLSSTFEVDCVSNERLISLTKNVGGNAYMCGGGAQGYQQDELFAKEGVKLIYQNFTPAPYYQFNTPVFVPGLSIIDLLMNLGIAGSRLFFNRNDRGKNG